ncbi:MAG: hypothetical protein HQK91_07065 [Nitrospirae bacterium]|nr:hypothetical protein [Nitrospirota bacterium]
MKRLGLMTILVMLVVLILPGMGSAVEGNFNYNQDGLKLTRKLPIVSKTESEKSLKLKDTSTIIKPIMLILNNSTNDVLNKKYNGNCSGNKGCSSINSDLLNTYLPKQAKCSGIIDENLKTNESCSNLKFLNNSISSLHVNRGDILVIYFVDDHDNVIKDPNEIVINGNNLNPENLKLQYNSKIASNTVDIKPIFLGENIAVYSVKLDFLTKFTDIEDISLNLINNGNITDPFVKGKMKSSVFEPYIADSGLPTIWFPSGLLSQDINSLVKV